MTASKKDYEFIFWVHLILTLIFLLSWLFFSWYIVLIGEIILQLQYWLLKGCVLSQAEFGNEEACIPYYLFKWKIIKNKKKTLIFFRYYVPLIVIALALILQLVFKISPLII